MSDLIAAAEALMKQAVFVFGDNETRWPAQWREELLALRAAVSKAKVATAESLLIELKTAIAAKGARP